MDKKSVTVMCNVVVCPGIPSVCKQVVSVETTRDIPWATFTCTLGFHVFGEIQAVMCNNTVGQISVK